MPALHDVKTRIAKDPVWQISFSTNLPIAERIAARVPIIHVSGASRFSFFRLFRRTNCELPTSAESPDYYSTQTIATEVSLGLGACAYFYAGRAHPSFGAIALAFPPSAERTHRGTVTPFDTGGLAHPNRYIRTTIPNDMNAIRAFTKKSLLRLGSWRRAFAQFLAAYFAAPVDYWTTKPCRSDPAEMLLLNDDWRAWTFEIRFREGQPLWDAIKWCASEPMTRKLKSLAIAAPPRLRPRVQAFLATALDANGSLNYCELIELWASVEAQS